MGYEGPCVGSITGVVFMARNPHSFTGSPSHMQRARMGCGRCCSSGPLLFSVWSSDNQNQKQSALTGAALILSWSPGKPDTTHPPSFLSLLPAKPISVSPGPLVVSLLLEPVGAQLPSGIFKAFGWFLVLSSVFPLLTHSLHLCVSPP